MIRKGVIPKPRAYTIRELTREDLARLREPRRVSNGAPARLRESHHRIARLAAAGLKNDVIAEQTGYSYNRICTLRGAPAMAELIANYRHMVDEAFAKSIDAYYEVATKNMLAAERMIADKLDEADETGDLPSFKELSLISRDAADRFGYGKKQTNVNVNVDFAAQLDRAIKRSGKVITIPNDPRGLPVPLRGVAGPTPLPAPPQPFRRRA